MNSHRWIYNLFKSLNSMQCVQSTIIEQLSQLFQTVKKILFMYCDYCRLSLSRGESSVQSEQTDESGETKFPIGLYVKCSTDFLPPGGHRKSVKSRYFGPFVLLFTYQKADDQKATTFFNKYYLVHAIARNCRKMERRVKCGVTDSILEFSYD